MYSEKAKYEISIQGHLDKRWAARFEEMSLENTFDGQGSPVTVLSGMVIDQPALHGILAKIRDLGITVISVNRIESK